MMMPRVPSEPDEELVEVGADGRPRRPAGADAATVGEGHVEAQHHVLDLPVAGRELTGRAAGQPAADRRQRDRLRPVAEGEPVRRAQLVLEVVAEGAGRHVEHQRGGVDVDDAGQPAEVEHDAAVQRAPTRRTRRCDRRPR